jgi:hypothetical protein
MEPQWSRHSSSYQLPRPGQFPDALTVYMEMVKSKKGLETVIQDLLSGQYNNPIRVVGMPYCEGRSSMP